MILGPKLRGSPWEFWPPFARQPGVGTVAASTTDTSDVPGAPTNTADVLLVDEGADNLKRVCRAIQVIARYLNPLIRKGVLRLDQANDDTILALSPDIISDALGFTPADAATEIPTGTGMTGGGTLGAPAAIAVDDTVVRFQAIGGGQRVLLLQSAIAPVQNPSGTDGYLYVTPTGNLTYHSSGGTLTVIASV